MSERGYLVHGRVQGVGFRWWARRIAEGLGLVGNVRNLRDGSVEVMAKGDDEMLERFADELSRGPTMARVDDVQSVAYTLRDAVDSFTIEQ